MSDENAAPVPTEPAPVDASPVETPAETPVDAAPEAAADPLPTPDQESVSADNPAPDGFTGD